MPAAGAMQSLDPAAAAPISPMTQQKDAPMTSQSSMTDPSTASQSATPEQSAASQSTAHVPTTSGSRYLQQLAKHWSHSLAVSFDEDHSRIIFPKDARGATWSADAVVTMDAQPETLDVTIAASSPEHLEALKGVVARHLDRFAFREAPLSFDWG